MPDQPNWSVIPLKKEYRHRRAVIGRYCSNLSRRPPAGKPCLSLTSRAVSSTATGTPFISRTRPHCGGPGRRSVMTVLQKPPHRGARGWFKLGHGDQPVRHTDAWEHETFAEEQARWERSDPEYARICEQVRQARQRGQEASQRADQAKAEWDARVAARRQADDDAQKTQHELKAEQSALRQTAASRVLALRRQLDLDTRVAGRAAGDPPGRARAPSGRAPGPGSHDARRQHTRRDPRGAGRRSLDQRERQPWC
jgi:hypothetical protein